MFLLRILNFIYGYYKIEADYSQKIKILNLMKQYNINYWNLKYDDEDGLTFKILRKEYKKLFNILDKNGCIVYIVYEKGLPNYFKRYRNRIGILFGTMIFFGLLWLSTLFIWDMEINGNHTVKDEIIIERLAKLGCEIGSFIPAIDFDKLCNDYILYFDDASWISVNLIGTVANVEMRERIKDEYGIADNRPANIIAKCDGFIESYQVIAGKREIEIATVVRKGDILISGVVEMKSGELKLIRAEGKINAVTNRSYTVNVPLNYTKKSYTGVSENKKTIKIFGKNINFYINDEISIEKYDKIVDVNRIILFGVIKLPVTIQTETYNEYDYIPWELTEDEARIIAEKKMTDLLLKELIASDVLEQNITSGIINDEYVITCDIRCLEDIAELSVILTD